MSTYEKFNLVISCLNLASLIFLVIQIFLSAKNSKDMHEEKRRIKTVEVLNNWNNGIKKESRLAEKIVGKLDQEQCAKLYDYNNFEVSNEIHDLICQMCSKRDIKCSKCRPNKKGNYLISGTQLTELRGNVTSYLNNLEIVAVAWEQAIVDRKEIELQFSFLHSPGKKAALSTYRRIAGGGNSYPALSAFYAKIEENNLKAIQQKNSQ